MQYWIRHVSVMGTTSVGRAARLYKIGEAYSDAERQPGGKFVIAELLDKRVELFNYQYIHDIVIRCGAAMRAKNWPDDTIQPYVNKLVHKSAL